MNSLAARPLAGGARGTSHPAAEAVVRIGGRVDADLRAAGAIAQGGDGAAGAIGLIRALGDAARVDTGFSRRTSNAARLAVARVAPQIGAGAAAADTGQQRARLAGVPVREIEAGQAAALLALLTVGAHVAAAPAVLRVAREQRANTGAAEARGALGAVLQVRAVGGDGGRVGAVASEETCEEGCGAEGGAARGGVGHQGWLVVRWAR